MPIFVTQMEGVCILGEDFLSKVGLSDCFRKEFLEKGYDDSNSGLICSRISDLSSQLPVFLEDLLVRDSEDLDSSQRESFSRFLKEFQGEFSQEIIAGNCEVAFHHIQLSNPSPIKQAPQRVPLHLRTEVEKIIEDMKLQGVIEESNSPWTSPVVMVKKKDWSIRFCVDYRKLNEVTIKDSYLLPRIDDILDQLSGKVWFTTLDLKSGYWQVKIAPEDKEKTAFSIGSGLWQFTIMPFGLGNASATFERLMEKVLQGLISKTCFVYLDDVIVYGKTFQGMMEKMQVFLRLRRANLKVNAKKCVFLKKKVEYLGHIVSAEGITTDPKKISAVSDWPTPKTRKQIRSFLGFCSYCRRFVKNFATIAKPLHQLTEENVKFLWTEERQEAFDRLKRSLLSSPVLNFPSGEGEFILDTDASAHGIGAVLSQKQGEDERVIAYFSRVFSKTERNYCVTRRELLAVVEATKSFHHYLYGRQFLVRTDHASLRWLLSFRNLEGQLARWMERLQQYQFKILHRSGGFMVTRMGFQDAPA